MVNCVVNCHTEVLPHPHTVSQQNTCRSTVRVYVILVISVFAPSSWTSLCRKSLLNRPLSSVSCKLIRSSKYVVFKIVTCVCLCPQKCNKCGICGKIITLKSERVVHFRLLSYFYCTPPLRSSAGTYWCTCVHVCVSVPTRAMHCSSQPDERSVSVMNNSFQSSFQSLSNCYITTFCFLFLMFLSFFFSPWKCPSVFSADPMVTKLHRNEEQEASLMFNWNRKSNMAVTTSDWPRPISL